MASITQYVERAPQAQGQPPEVGGRPRQETAPAGVPASSVASARSRCGSIPSARKRAKDRLRQLTSRKWGVSMEQRIEEINRYTVGWTTYYALADTPSVFEGLDEWLRRRLRQVRWKEWKRAQNQAAQPDRAGNPRARGHRVGLLAQGLLAHLRLPDPHPRPAQRLLGRPGPARDSPIPTAVSGMLSEPPDADPHVRWCGGRRGEPGAYPIEHERKSRHVYDNEERTEQQCRVGAGSGAG